MLVHRCVVQMLQRRMCVRYYGVFQVKRELLLVISVELTLQVPANADMYVVLSTKVSRRMAVRHLPASFDWCGVGSHRNHTK